MTFNSYKAPYQDTKLIKCGGVLSLINEMTSLRDNLKSLMKYHDLADKMSKWMDRLNSITTHDSFSHLLLGPYGWYGC